MASPQKENGYTAIANELFEKIYAGGFNASQFKILLFIFRYTYGFNRKSCKASRSYISEGTNLHEITVSKETARLISMNVLNVDKEATFKEPREISVNKDYETWRICIEVVKHTTGSQSATPTGSQSATPTGSQSATQENKNIKQNIKQECGAHTPKKNSKRSYGTFQNVMLTETERLQLDETMGDISAGAYIDKISMHKESSGTKYKNDYATVLKWWEKDGSPYECHAKVYHMPPPKKDFWELTPEEMLGGG